MTHKRTWTLLLLAALPVVLAGCLESEVELAVNKDGSGVVTETVWLTKAMMDMAGSMAPPAGPGRPKSEFNPMITRMADKAALEKRAAAMGEGVSLKSVKLQKADDGRQGYVALYDVKDVNTMKLGMNPATPQRGRGRGQAAAPKKGEQIQIQYKPGTGKITLVMPERKAPAAPGETTPPPANPQAKEMFEMMKGMFEGMKISVRLKVPGTITKTNASLVNDAKDGVTLIEMNVGALLQDEKMMTKLQAIGRIKNVKEASEKLNDPQMKKYVKFETAEKVEIEFK